jgi:hypothetical protein
MVKHLNHYSKVKAGNTKGGSIIVPLTSCLNGLDKSVLKIKTKIVSCYTADSKPVKQEVNDTVILPPLVFPGQGFESSHRPSGRKRCLNYSKVFLHLNI